MNIRGRDERGEGEVAGYKEGAGHKFKDPTQFYRSRASFRGQEGVIRDVF